MSTVEEIRVATESGLVRDGRTAFGVACGKREWFTRAGTVRCYISPALNPAARKENRAPQYITRASFELNGARISRTELDRKLSALAGGEHFTEIA